MEDEEIRKHISKMLKLEDYGFGTKTDRIAEWPEIFFELGKVIQLKDEGLMRRVEFHHSSKNLTE